MQITHAKLGQPGTSTRGKRLVTICAELAKPNEFMTITVAVLSTGTEQDVCERGVARAKDFAKQFVETPLQHFPMPRGKVRPEGVE